MYEIFMSGWEAGYSFMCEPVDKSPKGKLLNVLANWFLQKRK